MGIWKLSYAAAWTVVLTCSAWAQNQAATEENGALLRGPTVSEAAQRTLVRTDAMGRLVQLEQRPEVAALGLLVIDPVHRDQARQIIENRQTDLGMMLVDQIDVVRDITDAMRSGNQDDAARRSRELYDMFEPEHRRAPLLELLSEILPDDAAAELKRLVDEYWDSRVDWELRNAPDADEDDRQSVAERLAFSMFQHEMRAAYEWTLRPYHNRLQTIYEITEATEEQRAVIRAAIIDYVRESRLQPTAEQRRAVTQRIYDVLNEQQRLRLFEQVVLRM